MTPAEIQNHVTAAVFNSLRSLLSTPWRSGHASEHVSDEVVASTIEAEWRARRHQGPLGNTPAAALKFLPDPPAGWAAAALPAEERPFTYYDCIAQHFRTQTEKPHSGFEGLLPQVRVSLPEQKPADSLLARTAIGFVWTQDHLFGSVSEVRDRMKQAHGPAYADITRVDLISPARMGGRFGAIGLYLGYRNHSALPNFYALEAGLATGPSVRLYLRPDMGNIVKEPTAYLPTPFVELSNVYDGSLVMQGDEPDSLRVESYRKRAHGFVGPRVRVDVTYQLRTADTVTKLNPGDITLMAAERIALVGKALGEDAIDMQTLLAAGGDTLEWLRKPV